MAQEYRTERRNEVQDVSGDGARPGARVPESTEEARRAIEHTRGRISSTLDVIEGRLDETRDQLRERMNVLRPARERIRAHVWPSLGIALAAGLVLGAASGGGEEEEDERERDRVRERIRDSAGREQRRHWREERRARLEHMARQEHRGRRRRSTGGNVVRTITGAIVGGLNDRMRRTLTGR